MTMHITPERAFSGDHQPQGASPLVVEFTSSRARQRPIAVRAGGIELAGSGRLPVRAVDIDAHPDLRRRFRVELVPTFVVLHGPREIARLVGPHSRRELAAALRRALGTRAVAVEPPEPRGLWNDFTSRLWGFGA